MSRVVILDSGPLGLVSHPKDRVGAVAWAEALVLAGAIVMVPEIADYEVRRELLRLAKTRSIELLDRTKGKFYYLPLTTRAMLRAAEFWAEARRGGRPLAEPAALDGDVILAGQAAVIAEEGHEVVVATTNAGHLSLFVDAKPWQEIR